MSTLELTRPAWQASASCRGVGPDLMFDDERVRGVVCPGCPVRQECALWGLLHEENGVWGGYAEPELASLRALLGVAVEIPGDTRADGRTAALLPPEPACGTERGYAQHRRKHQPACEGCRAAHSAGEQGRRKVRKASVE